jgi:hypothetical protein
MEREFIIFFKNTLALHQLEILIEYLQFHFINQEFSLLGTNAILFGNYAHYENLPIKFIPSRCTTTKYDHIIKYITDFVNADLNDIFMVKYHILEYGLYDIKFIS